MKDVKEECRSIVTEALNKIAAEKNIENKEQIATISQ